MEQYIYIDGWKSNIRFSSAHIIPEYEKCGRLHGHTYAVHVKIFGYLDSNGIIIDFSILKEALKKIVSSLDHKVLIPEKSKLVKIFKKDKSIKLTSLGKDYLFPINDCVLLSIDSTSAEKLAIYILDKLIEKFSQYNQIKKIELGVDEGFGQGAKITKKLEGRSH